MESDAGLTPYELRVKRNIEENQRVLRSLGLLNPSFERKETISKTVRRSNVAVKSGSSFKPSDEPAASPTLLARRTRRSSSILKSQGYDEFDDVPIAADEENTPPHKRKKIAPEPVFGPIEGVSVGDWWSTRMECSAAMVHRPTVAGIHGKLGEGCFSIALSGGYEDDVDYGECFTYTGSGGRDLKGTKTNPKNLRTAPQTKDQVLEGPNAALALNIENQRPVRVIRGYKLPSPYAPEEGYRYDGLYSVERCWTTTGLSKFKVYKFALKRLPDQVPPPWVTNGSVIPAQNGHGESREEGHLEEENNGEDLSTTQSITADVTSKCFKSPSKCSPNSVQNIENEEVTVTENDSQVTTKGKRTSCESKETREKLPSTDSLNYSQQTQDEGGALKQIQKTPERNNRLSNSKMKSEAVIKDSESELDSLNFDQNISESKDETGKPSQMPLTRKRTPINEKLYTKGTQKESKSPEDSLKNVSQDKDENGLQTQITPKKRRLSSSTMLGSEEVKQEQKSPTCTLNTVQVVGNGKDENNTEVTGMLKKSRLSINSTHVLEDTLPETKPPSDLPNYTTVVSDNDETEEKYQMTPKRLRISSIPKLDSERTKQKLRPPKDSLKSMQSTSDDKVVSESSAEMVLKRNRRSSSSNPDIEGTLQESKCHIDSLNAIKNVSDDNDEIAEQTRMTSKRKRSPSIPKLNPEGTKQKLRSPKDSLNSMQSTSDDKVVSESSAEVVLKRNRRSSSSNPDIEGTLQESKCHTDSLNAIKNVSDDNDEIAEQTHMTSKRKRSPSKPKLDPEGTKQKLRSPKDSLNSMQSTSDDNVVSKSSAEMVLKRNRRSSSSNPDIEGTLQESKCHIDSLNAVKNVSDDNDEIADQTHMTSKRIRSPSTPKHSPEGTKQKPASPTDTLDSGQNVLEDKEGSVKCTQRGMKRNRRSSNPNEDSVLFVQESSSSNRTNGFKINTKIEHNRSDIVIPVDVDRLNGQGKLENSIVNELKLDKKSTDEENPKFSPCNNQLDHTGRGDNATKSPFFNCQVQLTPITGKYFNSQADRKSTGKSPNSTEKKVRFSPEVPVVFNYVQGRKSSVKNIPISSLESENQNSASKLDYSTCGSVEPIEIDYSQENGQTCSNNSDGDSKKQTSILKYFGPVRKAEDKRVSSRGILLRSNMRSVVANNFLSFSGSSSLKSDTVPIKNSSPQAKKLKAPSKKESAKSKRFVKTLSTKKNSHSSSEKKESLSPASSPVKQCSVSLFRLDTTLITNSLKAVCENSNRLEDSFLGWDWSIDEVEFLGFDSLEEPQFYGFEENSKHLTDFLLVMSLIEKISEAL